MSAAVKATLFPDVQNKSVYAGKFKDWAPQTHAAGKLTATSDSASHCLIPRNDRPPSPNVIRRFRATQRPDAGQARIFYGKANDPHLKWAAEMTHGVGSRPSITSAELVNPSPKTLFQQRCLDRKENIYASVNRAPLGKSHDQRHGLPSKLNPQAFTFGVPTELDIGAGGLINPNKSYAEVEKESQFGMDLYKRSHRDFDVGEQIHRGYTLPNFKESSKFGIPTPHENDGRHVSRTLKWLHEVQQNKASKIVSKRVDDFCERTQPQLGKVHDPIKDTLNVPSDHIFGTMVKPDEYGAGDLIHMRGPGMYLRGQDRQRGVIAAIRQHLKKSNYHNFQDLLSAFKHYDKSGCGKIGISDLRDACIQFNLPTEPELLAQLMDYCDTNKDGFIDYVDFANFLNWKDKMLSGFPPGSASKKDEEVAQEGDLVPKSPLATESTPRRLQKQIDEAIGDHRTSSSMYNAVVGGVSTRGYRTYGVPTMRTDLPAPRIKRIDDRKNYGDESDAYGLINPSIYSQRGVHDRDFLIPRTQNEIKQIFTNTGLKMTGETLENIYRTASERHPKGHVSVESFRTVMDELQARDIVDRHHSLSL